MTDSYISEMIQGQLYVSMLRSRMYSAAHIRSIVDSHNGVSYLSKTTNLPEDAFPQNKLTSPLIFLPRYNFNSRASSMNPAPDGSTTENLDDYDEYVAIYRYVSKSLTDNIISVDFHCTGYITDITCNLLMKNKTEKRGESYLQC